MDKIFTKNTIIDERFKILSKLGEGGMGTVFLALDQQLNRKVAIKVLKEAVSQDTDVFRRTLSEGKILSTLRHPSLASIYEVNMNSDRPHLIQEYIEGYTIRELLQRGSTLSLDETWNLLKEQAEVLAFLHDQSIMHRDIKPENIMIDTSGKSMLMDFGLAIRPDQTRITQEGAFVGTLAYCPPELIKGKDATPSSDIYQLSLVAYEAITGRNLIGCFKTPGQFIDLLFKSEWHQTILKSGIPEDLARIIHHGSSFEADKRPVDGSALLKIVDDQFNSRDMTPMKVKSPPARSPSAGKTRQRTLLRNSKKPSLLKRTTENSIIEKKTKIWQSRPFLIVLLFLLSITTAIVFSHVSNSATNLAEANSIIPNARAFILFPDGFYAFFQSTAGKKLSWSITSEDGIEICSDQFSRVAGGWNFHLQSDILHGGDKVILNILDEAQVLETSPLTLPYSILKEPLSGKFSYDSIVTRWELYGQGEVELILTDKSTTEGSRTPVSIKVEKGSKTKRILTKDIDFNDQMEITLRLTDRDKTVLDTVSGKPQFTLMVELDPENPLENIRGNTPRLCDSNKDYAKSQAIACLVIKDELLYFATRTGFLYSMKIDSNSPDLYTLLWKKSFREIPELASERALYGDKNYGSLEANSLRPLTNGVEVYGLKNGSFVYSYSKDGSYTKKKLPMANGKSSEFTLPEVYETIVIELPQGIIYSLSGPENPMSFFLNKAKKYKKIVWKTDKVDVRKAFNGLNKKFAWIFDDGQQAFIELIEEEKLMKGNTLLNMPLGNARKQPSTVAFDNERNCGLLSFGENLYSVTIENGKPSVKKLSIPNTIDAMAYQVLSCGKGRFVFLGAKFNSTKHLLNQRSATLKIGQVSLGTDPPVFKVFNTNKRVVMGTGMQGFSDIKKIKESRAIFTIDGQAFIIDTDGCSIVYHQKFYTTPNLIGIGEDCILLCKRYYGEIEGIPLN